MDKNSKIILILGGARSGKSSYALSLAKFAEKPFYIATGWAGDEEMDKRIKKHKQERGDKWTTIEEKFSLTKSIDEAIRANADFIIVDCITIWLSNMMLGGRDYLQELNYCIDFLKNSSHPNLVFVSNELGCGIVPCDKLSREFRDNAGIINKHLANFADEVYLCFCGIPIKIKG